MVAASGRRRPPTVRLTAQERESFDYLVLQPRNDETVGRRDRGGWPSRIAATKRRKVLGIAVEQTTRQVPDAGGDDSAQVGSDPLARGAENVSGRVASVVRDHHQDVAEDVERGQRTRPVDDDVPFGQRGLESAEQLSLACRRQ